jgi:hypothetical protein
MTAEQWRPIAAYEGYFEVSSLGAAVPRVS